MALGAQSGPAGGYTETPTWGGAKKKKQKPIAPPKKKLRPPQKP